MFYVTWMATILIQRTVCVSFPYKIYLFPRNDFHVIKLLCPKILQLTFIDNVEVCSFFAQSAKRHLQDALKMSDQDKQDILTRHLTDVQKMF